MSNPEPVRRIERVYVAGSALEIERAERMISELEGAGVHVTSTWPISVRDHGGVSNPADAPRDHRERLAVKCLAQVRDSDLLWFLVPKKDAATRGAWVELGYALARGLTVICSGDDTPQSIFCATGIEFYTDGAALELVKRIADKGVAHGR
jgi:nucleoside 2-deoxyribosyltransferase